MQPLLNARVARLAVWTATISLILAASLSFVGAHDPPVTPFVRVGATVLMWVPFVLALLFFLAQQTSARGRPVPWGPYVGDAWFLALVVCTLTFATFGWLRTLATDSYSFGVRSSLIIELVVVGAVVFRLFQLYGNAGVRRA